MEDQWDLERILKMKDVEIAYVTEENELNLKTIAKLENEIKNLNSAVTHLTTESEKQQNVISCLEGKRTADRAVMMENQWNLERLLKAVMMEDQWNLERLLKVKDVEIAYVTEENDLNLKSIAKFQNEIMNLNSTVAHLTTESENQQRVISCLKGKLNSLSMTVLNSGNTFPSGHVVCGSVFVGFALCAWVSSK